MTDLAVKVDHVYKMFTKGERYDSLRDLIPTLAKRALCRVSGKDELRLKEFWALNDLDFEIEKGEAVGLIGHNGAGKSTLLKILSGLMQPTRGRVVVNGRLSALIEVGAGFHQDLTGRENVFLNGVILGMSRDEIRRKFDEIVDFCGLEEFIDTPVKRYSSGMYARLGFSVAVHMEPDILVVDEVLSVGDLAFQAKGVEKMRSVLNGGATVLFVSHNLRAMSDLCDRCLLLNRGRVVEDGPTSRVIHTYMEQMKSRRQLNEELIVTIQSVSIGGVSGDKADFAAGEAAVVEIKIKAHRDVEKVACVLHVNDENLNNVFNISSERLGLPSMTLRAGEERTCRFELAMHLAAGSFYMSFQLYRYDTDTSFDDWDNHSIILMRSACDVRGVANLYPRASIY